MRQAIDDQMYCLEKLIDTEKRNLLYELVREKCIRTIHREKVMNFKKEEEKAYQLLIIIQRRRYKDFCTFMGCLRKTLHSNIVKILEKGGVTEVKVQLLQNRIGERNIEAELIRLLKCCVDESNDSGDAKKIVELLAELRKKDIHFLGTSNSGLSIFFQSETNDPLQAMGSDGESESMQQKLEKCLRSLLKIPDSWPPLVKEVTIGQPSRKHLIPYKGKMHYV